MVRNPVNDDGVRDLGEHRGAAVAQSMAQLVTVLACAVTFLVVRDLAGRSRRESPWAAVAPLVVVALVAAAVGAVESAASGGALGSFPRSRDLTGIVAMALPISVACAVAIVRGRRSRRRTAVSRSIAIFATLAACLLLGAVLVSSSRLGVVSALFGLLTMGVLLLASALESRTKWAILIGLALATALLAVIGLPSAGVVRVVAVADNAVKGHWPIWRDTMRLVGEYPLMGSGPATYGSAIQMFQTTGPTEGLASAGNDYLQLFAELGLLGAPIFLALLVIAFRGAVRAAMTNDDWNVRFLGLGCAGAFSAFATLSFVGSNTYSQANALTLAWIAGLAVSRCDRPDDRRQADRSFSRYGLVTLTCTLLLLASARLGLAAAFKDRPNIERVLCRFGLCDTGALQASEAGEQAARPAAAVPALLEAVWRDPADASRWCDLGDAMLKAGRVDEARTSFTQALALGPNLLRIHERAARFYFDTGDTRQALAQASLALHGTAGFEANVFAMYLERNVAVAAVLADGLPTGPAAPRQYLRSLMRAGRSSDASAVWDWLVSHRYADDADAREFVRFLFSRQEYEQAARTWGQYAGDRGAGYLQSTWIFDGGFESASSETEFEWKIRSPGSQTVVSIDSEAARSGNRSLRIRFSGTENVDYHHTSQVAFVTPGVYQFTGYIRAMEVTSDQGVAFHIFDSADPRQIDLWTPSVKGRVTWTKVEATFIVPPDVSLLTIAVARQKSETIDSQIAGTIWIDDITLIKVDDVSLIKVE